MRGSHLGLEEFNEKLATQNLLPLPIPLHFFPISLPTLSKKLDKVMETHYPASMPTILEAEAPLTTQNQLTLPAPFRKVLKVRGGKSRLLFKLTKDGIVVVSAAIGSKHGDEDPALKPFLNLLETDICSNPRRLRPVTGALVKKARGLVGGVKVDLDAPLED